jgi:hypothetical protein
VNDGFLFKALSFMNFFCIGYIGIGLWCIFCDQC